MQLSEEKMHSTCAAVAGDGVLKDVASKLETDPEYVAKNPALLEKALEHVQF